MKIYYLAHPVKSDEHFSVLENLQHALQAQKTLWELKIATIMPWWTYCQIYGAAEGELLTECLKLDEEVVTRMDGLILTGHRISHGMQLELDMANEYGIEVIDLTGMPFADYKEGL